MCWRKTARTFGGTRQPILFRCLRPGASAATKPLASSPTLTSAICGERPGLRPRRSAVFVAAQSGDGAVEHLSFWLGCRRVQFQNASPKT
jgi:hypothetical protein